MRKRFLQHNTFADSWQSVVLPNMLGYAIELPICTSNGEEPTG